MFSPAAHALDLICRLPLGQLVQNTMQLRTCAGRQEIRYLRLMEEQILGSLQ